MGVWGSLLEEWDSLLEDCGTVFGGGGGRGVWSSRLEDCTVRWGGGGGGMRQPGGSVDGDGKFAVYVTVGWSVWMEVAFFFLFEGGGGGDG